MSSKGDSLAEKVQASYLQLSAVASDLNAISDELGKAIAEIDSALKKLNLGVTVWVPIRYDSQIMGSTEFWSEDVGYAKIGGKWGIALRRVDGDAADPFQDTVESFLFNDGPRSLRLSAIEKLPELLQKLSEEAVETTNKIKSRLAEAQEVATAVKKAAWQTTRRIIAQSPTTQEPKK